MASRSKRVALCFAVISTAAAQIVTATYVSSRNDTDRNDQRAMELVDDLVRASQAEVAAERMVSMGRAYLLTQEPELLARAHAAEAKLQQTLQALGRRAAILHEGPLFDPLVASARRYGELFQRFLADPSASATPRAVADALRKHLLPARDRFEIDLEDLITRRKHQIDGLYASTRELSSGALPMMIGVGILGLFAAIMLVRLVGASNSQDGAPKQHEESPPNDGRTLAKPASVPRTSAFPGSPRSPSGAHVVRISKWVAPDRSRK